MKCLGNPPPSHLPQRHLPGLLFIPSFSCRWFSELFIEYDGSVNVLEGKPDKGGEDEGDDDGFGEGHGRSE